MEDNEIGSCYENPPVPALSSRTNGGLCSGNIGRTKTADSIVLMEDSCVQAPHVYDQDTQNMCFSSRILCFIFCYFTYPNHIRDKNVNKVMLQTKIPAPHITMAIRTGTVILCSTLFWSITLVLGAKEEMDDPKGPSSTINGPTVEATDPDAFCSMPDIAKSVDWSHEDAPFKVGHSLILKCHNGSETLLGPSTIKLTPVNGTLTPSAETFFPGTTVQYGCDKGYIMVGTAQLSCMDSGQWTGDPPMCQEECPTTDVINGILVTRCTYRNCTAWIKCNEGFFVIGKNKLMCSSKGVWRAEDRPKCEAIMCAAPPPISSGTFRTEPLPRDRHRYIYHTIVMYTCLDQSYVLHGAENLTYYDDTFVTSEPVTVSYNDTEGHSTSRGTPRSCPDLEHVPYASYAIRNHSRLVTYTCNFGYELHGSGQRECLANGSWSGESPTCLPARMEHIGWKTIFRDNKEWKGSYLYNEVQVGFRFWYLKSAGTSIQTLLLDDLNAKLDLKGVHLGDLIIFETTRLLVPSEILHDTGWQVRGQLINDTQGWKFSAPPLGGSQEYASATALALGVAIAIMAIIVAALLAAYCVKRKGGFKGTGHRTLTSFENPVYEYENNAAVKEPRKRGTCQLLPSTLTADYSSPSTSLGWCNQFTIDVNGFTRHDEHLSFLLLLFLQTSQLARSEAEAHLDLIHLTRIRSAVKLPQQILVVDLWLGRRRHRKRHPELC
ncbi:hypothetical protein LSH36_395g01037 [Paralvinella palmiformis]|uniref:Sushi domain-containing protein n=1 Tax=Paralvinella palmiformis TaxID=53620 RepID=A0AAD9N1E6_9ANNE|nr:hypothetical protein LSH36_395g01037 [Paralvinella palmiformis]